MQYVDFAYYQETFCGGLIQSAEEFNSLEVRARAYVDKITFGRAAPETEAVKNAVCACCEIYNTYGQHEGISSEDNDGYRVTYISNQRQMNNRLYQAAMLYLPVSLLYRGYDA